MVAREKEGFSFSMNSQAARSARVLDAGKRKKEAGELKV